MCTLLLCLCSVLESLFVIWVSVSVHHIGECFWGINAKVSFIFWTYYIYIVLYTLYCCTFYHFWNKNSMLIKKNKGNCNGNCNSNPSLQCFSAATSGCRWATNWRGFTVWTLVNRFNGLFVTDCTRRNPPLLNACFLHKSLLSRNFRRTDIPVYGC